MEVMDTIVEEITQEIRQVFPYASQDHIISMMQTDEGQILLCSRLLQKLCNLKEPNHK